VRIFTRYQTTSHTDDWGTVRTYTTDTGSIVDRIMAPRRQAAALAALSTRPVVREEW
jgi:hypothetical protein